MPTTHANRGFLRAATALRESRQHCCATDWPDLLDRMAGLCILKGRQEYPPRQLVLDEFMVLPDFGAWRVTREEGLPL